MALKLDKTMFLSLGQKRIVKRNPLVYIETTEYQLMHLKMTPL